MNVINNSREDDVKTEDDEIGNVNYRYIGDKYKALINNIFNHGLKEKDLHLTGIENRIMEKEKK